MYITCTPSSELAGMRSTLRSLFAKLPKTAASGALPRAVRSNLHPSNTHYQAASNSATSQYMSPRCDHCRLSAILGTRLSRKRARLSQPRTFPDVAPAVYAALPWLSPHSTSRIVGQAFDLWNGQSLQRIAAYADRQLSIAGTCMHSRCSLAARTSSSGKEYLGITRVKRLYFWGRRPWCGSFGKRHL